MYLRQTARQYVQEGRVPSYHPQKGLDPISVADNAYGQAFNAEALLTQVNDDWLEVAILWQQLHDAALLFQALNRHFIVNARNHNLPITHILSFVNRQQVTVENTDITHRHPANAQQEIRARFK